MPGEADLEVLRKIRNLAGRGEAADVRHMMADVIDLPRLHQWLPLVRVIPQLADRHRRRALLAHDGIVSGFLRGEQVLAEEQSELLQVLRELHAADRIDD